jgi:hypothetical protein
LGKLTIVLFLFITEEVEALIPTDRQEDPTMDPRGAGITGAEDVTREAAEVVVARLSMAQGAVTVEPTEEAMIETVVVVEDVMKEEAADRIMDEVDEGAVVPEEAEV